VTRRLLFLLVAGFWPIFWLHPVCSGAEDACEEWWSRWVAASQLLNQSMESYRHIKEASLASRIEQELKDPGNAVSVAASVQAALKERSAALEQQGRKCHEKAMSENQAFEQWRRCAGRGDPRRGGLPARSLAAAASERKRLLASLQDLLLDEAYAQYKNYQPPTPPSYSGYDQQPWGVGRNTGYRAYQENGGYR
jgi:hypothetical protein